VTERKLLRRSLYVAVAVLLTLCVVAVIMRYGDPQWNKWIYIFQNVVSPGRLPSPERHRAFSGIWRDWYSNGSIYRRWSFKRGLPDGVFLMWDINGTLRRLSNWTAGLPDGLELSWDENGSQVAQGYYAKGERYDGTFYQDGLISTWTKGKCYDGVARDEHGQVQVYENGSLVYEGTVFDSSSEAIALRRKAREATDATLRRISDNREAERKEILKLIGE